MLLREILNRYRWDPQWILQAPKVTLVLLHRGAEGDEVRLPLQAIQEVGEMFLTIDQTALSDARMLARQRAKESALVPLHRVLQVRQGSALIWRASTARPSLQGREVEPLPKGS